MLEKIKTLFLENLSLKVMALVLAVLVWAAVTGRERADSEKTLRVPVELTNVSESIEVRSVKPEEVSLSLHGATQIINGISQQNMKIRIDLKDMVKSGRINFYAEDHLRIPEGIHILSVHPKMIEINIEEFVIREIPVKIHFIGRLKSGLTLKEARVNPEKVTVIGFRPQITEIESISTEPLNLATVENSINLIVALKKTGNVLRFQAQKEVEVTLDIAGSRKTNEK
jgi:YbbR domain-containing protein